MAVKHLLDKPSQKSHPYDEELKDIISKKRARIKVVGAGGAGNNTITRLMQIGIAGADTLAINTDAQDLLYTDADNKILIGRQSTQGLGAGANPKVGMEAARETREELKKALQGATLVFLTCGLGGGTGTGSLPVVADIAKKQGALTIAVVTLPFSMEGKHRYRNAEEGLKNLEEVVDTLILVPNDKLLDIAPQASLMDAFKLADEILVNAVKGITELITKPGLVNRDFADVKAVMSAGGLAMIGMGESDTKNRAMESVEKALNNPLISVSVDDAKGALINISSGATMSVREAQQIVKSVSDKLSPDAKIIWGAKVDKELGNYVKTMLIITGVKSPNIFGPGKTWSQQTKKDVEKVLGVEFVE